MNTKKQETVHDQMTQSPGESGAHDGNTTCIVHDHDIAVKPEGNLLRQIEESGIKPLEMIAVIQRLYPGYEKTLHSKCKNGEKYGIMLRPDAMDVVIAQFAPEFKTATKQDCRTKPKRIQARLSEATYNALQQVLHARGVTVQQWIEDLALALIAREGEKDGH